MRIDDYARLMDHPPQQARLTPATVISDDDGILYLMHEVSRSARRVYDAQVAEIGLNQTQWRIIGQLLRNPSLTQAEIAKALELESASIGQAVVALCERGLIQRSRAETDGRAWRLALTEELDALLPALRGSADNLHGLLWRDITAEEKHSLREILTRLAANLDQRSR